MREGAAATADRAEPSTCAATATTALTFTAGTGVRPAGRAVLTSHLIMLSVGTLAAAEVQLQAPDCCCRQGLGRFSSQQLHTVRL